MNADNKPTFWNKFIGIVLGVLMAAFALFIILLFLSLAFLSAKAGVG